MQKIPALLKIAIVIIGVSCSGTKNLPAEELFKSSVLMPVNSFTSGAEGPAVDKDGVLYAVNFSKQGTVGKIITSSATGSIFIELSNGSIGNGMRFSRNGDMFIADYTNHNVLRVDMSTKQVSVFAHE